MKNKYVFKISVDVEVYGGNEEEAINLLQYELNKASKGDIEIHTWDIDDLLDTDDERIVGSEDETLTNWERNQ